MIERFNALKPGPESISALLSFEDWQKGQLRKKGYAPWSSPNQENIEEMLRGEIKIVVDLPRPAAFQLDPSLFNPLASEIAVNTGSFLLNRTDDKLFSEQRQIQKERTRVLGIERTRIELLDTLSSIYIILKHYIETGKNLVGRNFIRTATPNDGLHLIDVGDFDTKRKELHVNQLLRNDKSSLIWLPNIAVPVKA